MCTPFLDYQKINPNTQKIIIGDCVKGCYESSVSSFSHTYTIYQEWIVDSRQKWIECVNIDSNSSSTSLFNLRYFKF